MNWNRHFEHWEVWLYHEELHESTAYEKIRVRVDTVIWEATEYTGTETVVQPGGRRMAHNQGQPAVQVTNEVEAAAWNQFTCAEDTNNDGRCTASDRGFEWTGTWGAEPTPPAQQLPGWIMTACAGDAVFFTASDGKSETCP